MENKKFEITRRGFIGTSIATVFGLANVKALGLIAENNLPANTGKKRAVRFAHITDIHLTPDRNAPKGFATALHHIELQKDKPQMVLTGGDHIMDSIAADDSRTKMLWELFRNTVKDNSSLPFKYCIGNHDCWGLNHKRSKTTGREANWGWKRAVEELSMPGRFYSFVQGNWRLIMLDSITPIGNGYNAIIDDQQLQWLESELQDAISKKQFVSIFTHVPIVSVGAYFYGDYEKQGNWNIPASRMVVNARKLKDMFWKYKQAVKLCVSGHIHFAEHIVYNDVHYISNGAVCGAWWNGRHQETEEGYGLFDLYNDGTFDYKYVDYGWNV